ncbi:MAG: LTA synthase family protein [Fibrobacter sp.]|nr:LTA synthase family protein [Fibrobacter sp.]
MTLKSGFFRFRLSKDLLSIILLFLFLAANAYKCTVFRLTLCDLKNPYFTTTAGYFFTYLMLCSFVILMILRLKQFWLSAVFYVLQLLFLTINLSYYFFFEGYPHLSQYIHLYKEVIELVAHSGARFEPGLLIVLIDLPLFAGVFFLRREISFRNPVIRYSFYLPFLIFLIKFARWDNVKDSNLFNTMDDRYTGELQAIQKFGIGPVNLVNLFRLNQNTKNLKILGDRGKLIEAQIDTTKETPGFFLIQVESMESFIVNKKHKKKHVTPFLKSLSKTAIYYPYVLSYHKAGSTSDCEFSVINSQEPLDQFPSMKIRNYNFPNSLAKSFVKDSFEVKIFHGNRGEYFNRRIALKKMGFPAFYDIFDMKLKEVCWGAPDHDVFNFTLNSMKSARDPFFYYVITMSSHEPFTFTRSYYHTTWFDDISEKKVQNYFKCMSYIDSTLKSVIQEIRTHKPNTVIMIYGDHTPGIKDGPYTQASFKESGIYYEFTPLFIITPDNRKYSEKKRVASFLDIAPTVLSITGNSHGIHSYGVNLLEPQDNFRAVPFRGTMLEREKLFAKIDSVFNHIK